MEASQGPQRCRVGSDLTLGHICRTQPRDAVFPCAPSVLDHPLPAGGAIDSVQHGRCVSANPEDGRRCLRNHAPQDVILFVGLQRQVSQEVALRGVLDLALPARRVQSSDGYDYEGTRLQGAAF